MTVAFTAGGTGGHIYPAIAVAEELKRMDPEIDIRFISGTREIERTIIENAGYPLQTISVIGMPRSLSPRLAVFAVKLGTAAIRSFRILREMKPSCLLATGGYVSGPPVLAAYILGIPVLLQEQNSYPGIATRRLAKFSDVVFLGFADAGQYFGKASRILTGNPVRRGIEKTSRNEGASAFGLDPAKKTALVFGGSQGAHMVNKAISSIVDDIVSAGYQLIWQTGAGEYEQWSGLSRQGSIAITPYIDKMNCAYAVSDIVIARAGAMTIAELNQCGLPSILVPLPTAAENHQEYNARSLETVGAARVILERDLTPETLKSELFGLLENDSVRETMSSSSRKLGGGDAARMIAEYIFNNCSEN
jgi:UDP-N-acetylglucosamine--N-acetylmuramyl-(pentapeptide) pyrophosphoryl-undecaprenol N-acetylglucosamine transferase